MRSHRIYHLALLSSVSMNVAAPSVFAAPPNPTTQSSTTLSPTSQGPTAASANAVGRSASTSDGIRIDATVEDVVLNDRGELAGALVDPNGTPIENAPVVVGQMGKPVAEATTAADGRFVIANLTPGTYQIATYAKVQNYRVHRSVGADANNVPKGAKEGVIHVMPTTVSRGAAPYGNLPPEYPRAPLIRAVAAPLLVAGMIGGVFWIGEEISDGS